MKLVFMGTPAFALPALRALAAHHEIVSVYSQPPRPAGRGKALRPSPVHAAADEMGLALRCPQSLRTPDAQADFAALGADAAIVVAYGLILPPEVLAAPRHGCLNIHASLLPRWRGAAPIQRAIMAGDEESGICIMRMERGLDTGPVLLRERVAIGPEDTAGALHDRLALLGADLIVRALEGLANLPAKPQQEDAASYAPKIDKAEARLDFTRPALEVDRLIRALAPAPGAWCMLGGERVKLLGSRLSGARARAGELVPGAGLTIGCGDGGCVEVLLAQREGKRPMPAQEVLKGLRAPVRLSQ